jgi:transcriptional/translational regulatory protein YebC/TACO1
MFEKMGVLSFDKEKYCEEQIMEVGLEAGIEDVQDDGEVWQVRCAPEDYNSVKQAFEESGMEFSEAEVTMVPQNKVPVDAETGRKLLDVYEKLDDHDDVQNVYANFELTDEAYQELQAG